MNKATLRLLGFVVAGLVATLLLIESGDDGDLPGAGSHLFPDMRAVANDINRVVVVRAGDSISIEKRGGGWVVPDRGGYEADVATVTEVLLAMTEAAVVERKTANPDLHDRLGVDMTDTETSKGTTVLATADDNSFQLIFGNAVQQNFRYARIAGDNQSWLIDQNPEIPTEPGDWLNMDIIDIGSNHIRSVTIEHPDGEVISIRKDTEADVNFMVADVPAGRELSYSTVANGIGGVLNDLDLDDVRERSAMTDAVKTRFETFDNVGIDVAVSRDDKGAWISIDLRLPGEGNEQTMDEWSATRARVDGWAYRIADYKANLLARRWDDILKVQSADEE
ncbi:MAG: DUF4340 domain-containing protein [Woeseiaceae bacterium]|nr:DUF4340 domain-containing protein [Woeseiaceae bacterium]